MYALSALLFVLSYLYTKQPLGSVFDLNWGYSVWWFICLYVFAGSLRLYPFNIKKIYIFIIYFYSTLFLWIFSMFPTNNYFFYLIHNTFEYTSPLVIIASISLLLLFKGVDIKNLYLHNIICFVATLTFGVHLIEGSCLSSVWYWQFFKIQNYYDSPLSPLWVMAVALEMFIFFALIEIVRKSTIKIFIKVKLKHKRTSKETQGFN